MSVRPEVQTEAPPRRRHQLTVMASLPARPTETASPPSSARTPATPAKVDAQEARKRMADALDEFVDDHRELLTALAK